MLWVNFDQTGSITDISAATSSATESVASSGEFENYVARFGEGANGAYVSLVAKFPFSIFTHPSIDKPLINADSAFPMWSVRLASGSWSAAVHDRVPDAGFFFVDAAEGSTETIGSSFSSEKEILTFSVPGQIGEAAIDSAAGNVAVTVGSGTDRSSLTATFTLSDKAAGAKVNAVLQVSGVTSNNFTAPVTYKVIAEDNSTKDWTVTVTELGLTDLADMALRNAADSALIEFSPAFAPASTAYTATVGADVTAVQVKPTVADVEAGAATVDGTQVDSGTWSGNISLNVGENVITVLVTVGAETKEYTITITRASNLSGLALRNAADDAAIALDPEFAPDTTGYTASVSFDVQDVQVQPEVTDEGATITVNDVEVNSGDWSGDIPLSLGENVFEVVVTSGGGTTREYTITITRLSNDADLSNLALQNAAEEEAIALEPEFAPETTEYSASVGLDVTDVQVQPTVSDIENATITVDGEPVINGDWSQDLPLALGANEIIVEVTAEDGTQKTYTITITRAASGNADLNGLALRRATIPRNSISYSPAFAVATTAYSAAVGNNVTGVQMKPTVDDQSAEVTVNDADVASGDWSGDIPLIVGINVITVVVTAEDDTQKEYTITITRNGPSAPPANPVEERTVNVEIPEGEEGFVVSKVPIQRTTHPDGSKKERVNYGPDWARETIDNTVSSGKDTARIVIPDEKDEVTELTVNIPRESSKTISDGGIDLEIYTDNGRIIVPAQSMKSISQDLYFRIIPVKDETERQAVEQRARTEEVSLQQALGREIIVVERPSTIETNMPSQRVTIILPLKETRLPDDPVQRAEYLQYLFVYIEHTDGEKIIRKGDLVPYKGTETYGIQFDVEKFSTFAVVYMAAEFTSYSVPNQTGPADIDSLTGTITLEVASGTDLSNLAATFTLSPGATATVNEILQTSGITANNFTTPITYLVTARDGLTKLWTVTVVVAPEDRHTPYIKGYPDKTFRPERSISRAEVTAMIYRVSGLTGQLKTGPSFPDIAKHHWAYGVIRAMQGVGLVGGYPDGTFGSEKGLTRAEMASIISRWVQLPASTVAGLGDVNGHWAQGVIGRVIQARLMGGYPDGTFRPDREITRAEAVATINRVLKRGPLHGVTSPVWPDVSLKHWAFKDIAEASVEHYYRRTEEGLEMLEQIP